MSTIYPWTFELRRWHLQERAVAAALPCLVKSTFRIAAAGVGAAVAMLELRRRVAE
jgi:hypothetical protein